MNFATEHHRQQSVDVAVHHIESARCQQSAQDVHLRRGLRSNGHHRTDLHGFRLFVGWSKSRRGDLSPLERRFDFKFLNFRGSLRVTTPRYLHTVRRAAARVSPCKASSHLPRRTASCPAPLSTCSRPSQLLRWAPVIGLHGNTGLFLAPNWLNRFSFKFYWSQSDEIWHIEWSHRHLYSHQISNELGY